MQQKVRKNIRLRNYDYSQNGCYYVTICTDFKQLYLSKIVKDSKTVNNVFSPVGRAVDDSIQFIHKHYDGVSINKYCIMPNHVHLLITLGSAQGGHGNPPLRDVVGRLKSFTTKQFREIINQPDAVLWQHNYYEHIIRNDEDYMEKWRYIDENPAKWLLNNSII